MIRKIIFVVDDNDTNLSRAEEALESYYDVMTIPSGAGMLKLIQKVTPDLILLDISMPEMDGFEVLARLKSHDDHRSIPVIFLTGLSDVETEVKGFEMGVVDFINKPFSYPVLLNRVRLQISVNELIKERTSQLERAHRNLIFILSDLVENRDKGTGGHIERTTQYIRLLVKEMIKQDVYADQLINWDMEMVSACAILHDIGKIGVSDIILNKPDALTTGEFESIKTHAANGADIIDKVIARAGEDAFLSTAKLFAEYHHEKWDGSGYPHGLKGEKIPIHGRVMALVDVYDALVSERPYKKAFSHEDAARIIMEGAGRHFDPKVAEVFYSVRDKFMEIYSEVHLEGGH